MLVTHFSKYIFWSYNSNADLPNDVIIKQVALYGEINDLIKLSKLYRKDVILKVLNTFNNKNPKRVNFISKVIL